MSRVPLRRLLLTAVLGGSLVLAGCFYLALRTRTLDASQLPPFASLVGRELPLLRDARIVRTRAPDVRVNPWRLLGDPAQGVSDDEPAPLAVPAGTRVRFSGAQLIRGGTSGTTHPTLLGTLQLDGQSHAFEYGWGEPRHLGPDGTLSFGPPLRFAFPLAPWQAAADPTIYTFPEP